MKYFIDTEFDGYRGDLLSMALVREDGVAKYWVLHKYWSSMFGGITVNDPWVQEHVVPFLFQGPYEVVMTQADLSREIARFLKKDEDPVICADWPDDIKYFCDVMVFGPGKCRNIKSCKFEFDRGLGSYESEVPHNAYYDAMAIWKKFHLTHSL